MAYQIQKGDSLSSIAKKEGTTTKAILDANKGIKDPNKIYAGSNLNIPKAESGQKPVQPTIPPVAPVVQPAVPKVDETITTENIKPVVSPINLPDAKTPTYAGVDGAVESVINSSRAQKAMDEQPAQANYLQAILDQGTISSSIDRQEQDRAKRESDKYTSMLEQEQLAGRRRIEKIRKNETGMLSSGIAIEEDRLNRESLSKQADIAILQTAANRNYDTAKSIADRSVALKLEQSKANLEALKLLDSREYGDIQAKKEREYKILDRNENAIAELKLKVAQYAGSSAPSILSKLSTLDTTKPAAYDEAIAIAGKYAEDPLDRQIKQAQLNKLTSAASDTPESSEMDKNSDFKKLKGNAELKAALEDYKKTVEKEGARKETNPNAAVLKEKYGAVLQAYRAAVDLGALQGSDVQLVDDAIKKATYEGVGFFPSVLTLGIAQGVRKAKTRSAAEKSIESAFSTINRNNSRLEKILSASNPSWVSTPYYQAVTGITGDQTPQSEEDAAKQYMQAGANLVWDALETETE